MPSLNVEVLETRDVPTNMWFIGARYLGGSNPTIASNWQLQDGSSPADPPGPNDTAIFDHGQLAECLVYNTVTWGK